MKRKTTDHTEIHVSSDGVELSGVAEMAWPLGWIVTMEAPFEGLRVVVPIAPDRSDISHDVVLQNALLLLYKKADYFLENRPRIEAAYKKKFHRLNAQHAERSKLIWSKEYSRNVDKKKRLLSTGKISREEYRKQKIAAREEMLAKMTKLQVARGRVRKKLLGGIMNIEDVEIFENYFSKHPEHTRG